MPGPDFFFPHAALLLAALVVNALGVYFQLPAMTYLHKRQNPAPGSAVAPHVSLWLPKPTRPTISQPLRMVEKNLSGPSR